MNLIETTKSAFNGDEKAVSPVIGVILMVAITVILAAVIATFVLGLGDQLSETAPQASFDTNYNSSALEITHSGGESIPVDRLNVSVNGTEVTDSNNNPNWNADGGYDVKAGNTTVVASGDVSDGSTVRVIWTNAEETNSATLAEWRGPNA